MDSLRTMRIKTEGKDDDVFSMIPETGRDA
jgi:hypothetical protein